MFGVNIDQYESDLDTNQDALQLGIAECMTDVPTSSVTDLVVSALSGDETGRRLGTTEDTHPTWASSSSSSVLLTYTVAVNSPSASYTVLSTQLNTSVTNGNFTAFVQSAAVSMGASALVNASSYSVSIEQLLPSTDDNGGGGGGGGDEVLSQAAVIGIGVGGGAAVLLGVGGAWWWFQQGKTSSDLDTPINK